MARPPAHAPLGSGRRPGPEAPTSAFDRITAEQVWQLAHRLYGWLTCPVRKLPHGVTLAQLAGDGLGEYRDDADACLSTFAVQAEERGVLFGFACTAAHGGLACSHWWRHPRAGPPKWTSS
jgi:hypothetical protein